MGSERIKSDLHDSPSVTILRTTLSKEIKEEREKEYEEICLPWRQAG